ncbi:MAG: iron ABC transporter permease [Candidatus Hydrogenedentes bacterium]|nr:iron ABC transporter permease [Candidatus Hydrogenedentota bacterium]
MTRTVPYKLVFLILLAALPIALCVAAGMGAYSIAPFRIPAILWDRIEGEGYRVLLYIRLPRIFLATLVGTALALSGAALQSMFRNPLADSGLIGVSSGAALAASAWIALAGADSRIGLWGLPTAAFAGGLATVWLVWRMARTNGATPTATLLLTGIALNAIAGAGIGLLIYCSDEEELRGITFWQLGGLNGTTWPLVWAALIPLVPGLVLLAPLGRALNALALGDREAYHLGVHVAAIQRRIVLGSALAVGGAVAAAGGVGFVGLVVPHMFRLLCGADNRWLLPSTAVGGALLLLGADTASRTLAQPAELPVGILTALAGGPFFLWLLLRHKREAFHA